MNLINNPILPGFHPDPSICRVENDYYIATSTFNWFPGVRIHHSRDLVHWRFVGNALTTIKQVNLMGNQDCGGVWAPCLTWADGLFWLVYTDTKAWTGPYKDSHNYVITAPSITGPWSAPVHVNSSGFDASLFHDGDGRKWFLNVLWDHRPGRNPFSGILLQEFDVQTRSLVGPARNIFAGTALGLVEGPHLYRKDDWYYLLTAEGGTGWNHAVTIARSRNITGPYTVHPKNPLLTSALTPQIALQRAGHGSLVETPAGEWYLAHLCGRPIMPERRCILGRETALQKLIWPKNEWPCIDPCEEEGALNTPRVCVKAPAKLPENTEALDCQRTANKDSQTLVIPEGYGEVDFSQGIDEHWNALRRPIENNWASVSYKRGWLRMWGGESLFSLHRQSILARRILNFNTRVECCMFFAPTTFQQMAGLIFYYDTTNYHYLRMSSNGADKIVGVFTVEGGAMHEYPQADYVLTEEEKDKPLRMRGILQGRHLQFFWTLGETNPWQAIGPVLDATVLSDEYKAEVKFMGAYAGICVQDLSGTHLPADFSGFSMQVI